jgi:hypothetical protein
VSTFAEMLSSRTVTVASGVPEPHWAVTEEMSASAVARAETLTILSNALRDDGLSTSPVALLTAAVLIDTNKDYNQRAATAIVKLLLFPSTFPRPRYDGGAVIGFLWRACFHHDAGPLRFHLFGPVEPGP